jgi:hypothetical protein
MKIKYGIALGAVLGLAATRMALAQPTALELIKNGDDYVGVQSKDKILQIHSDKSVTSLEPSVWYVVFYDPSVPLRSVQIKFGAGQEMDVSHPFHPFQMPARTSDILDQSKLKVDSDRALDIAQSQPLLKGLTLRASKMTLENSDNGPVWKVELWAAKLHDSTRDANIGTVRVSAEDGSVVKSDLDPSSAD